MNTFLVLADRQITSQDRRFKKSARALDEKRGLASLRAEVLPVGDEFIVGFPIRPEKEAAIRKHLQQLRPLDHFNRRDFEVPSDDGDANWLGLDDDDDAAA